MSKVKGNVGVERVVLSGLCQYGKDAFVDISDIIDAKAFSIDSNQALYKCIEKVLSQVDKPDITSILAAADSLGLSELLTKQKIDIDYIRSLFSFPIKLENIRPHAKQLAKIDIIRKEQLALMDAYNKLQEFDGTESINEILSVPETAVFEITNELNNRNEEAPVQIVAGTRERLQLLMEKPIENIGIPTPWPRYNHLIGGGIRPGVTLIGARPKTGKSTLAINAGLHIAKLGIPVLYIDTEMNQEEQEKRITACEAQVSIDLVETGKFGEHEGYKHKIFSALDRVETLPFYHKWVGGREFEEILSIVRRWIYHSIGFDEFGKTKPHLIIYDYFKLMDDGDLNKMQEYQAIGFQISYLSDFCKKYGTPCLSFVQVNRDGITKDTSDIISMSDRLLWLCTSCCVFKKLSRDEIVEHGGNKFGNRRMTLIDGRFAKELEEGDYICMNFDGERSKVTEIDTHFSLMKKKNSNDSGFEIDENSESGEVISED